MGMERSDSPTSQSPSILEISSIQIEPTLDSNKIFKDKYTSPEIILPAKANEKRNARRTIDDYEVVSMLGEGAYGFVRLVKLKSDPEEKKYVLKYILRNRVLQEGWIRDKSLGGLLPLEVHILHTLNENPNHNIVKMVEFFHDMDFFYIVTELHGLGVDLFDYIELNQQMVEQEIKYIFRQIVEAVNHLHTLNIVHRDIKDENVIVNESKSIQLIDFGSSDYLKEGKKFETFYGTLDYCSPEVLTGHKYDGRPQDVWALGILLYTMIYKENPFYNIDEIISGDLRVPFNLSEVHLKSRCQKAAHDTRNFIASLDKFDR
ncbi:hypothetical protein HK096_010000 [Nowakowskiella sp. JEL0078]|nr:hypothetical protein HK096_010000 [Nowakowskiella sp. JEL0078]